MTANKKGAKTPKSAAKPAAAKPAKEETPASQADITRKALEALRAKSAAKSDHPGGQPGKPGPGGKGGFSAHQNVRGSAPPRRTQGKGG